MSTDVAGGPSPRALARERRLLRAARRGDRRARDRLVEAQLPLVRAVAHRYRDLGLPLEDLVQEGSLGLLDAIERFDGRRSPDFATFARWRVRRAVLNALTEQARLVRLPKQVVESRRALAQLDEETMKMNGRHASTEELAEGTGLTVAAVTGAREAPCRAISIDRTAPDGGGLESLLADPAAADPAFDVLDREERRQLARALRRLPPRQRLVLARHFGLDSDPESLSEIGRELHVSTQRVRAIERAAFARLADDLSPLLRDGG